MDVLLIGAIGYIGAAVSEHLTAAGHRVIALTRPAATGPDTRRGDLTDPRSLAAAVTLDIDAVIHVGAPTDATTDPAAVRALAEPLRGTGLVLIYTSGTWVLGPPASSRSTRTPSRTPSTSSGTARMSSATYWTPPQTASAVR